MIAASRFHGNSQRINRSTAERSEFCFISLARHPARVNQEKKMEYTQHNDDVSIFQSNFRAEDGLNSSNALYEGVVIPLASLFAVVFFVIGAMMLSN
jgi:hypothetical protein